MLPLLGCSDASRWRFGGMRYLLFLLAGCESHQDPQMLLSGSQTVLFRLCWPFVYTSLVEFCACGSQKGLQTDEVRTSGQAHPLLASVFVRNKPDRTLGRIGRSHEIAQGIEDLLELNTRISAEGVVPHGQRLGLLLQGVKPLGQVTVTQRELAQLHEGAHYIDRHLHGTRAAEHRGCLNRAMLGERQRQLAPPAVSRARRT